MNSHELRKAYLWKEMKEEMKAGEARVNRRIDELKEEMREIRGLLIQALQLSPAAKP